MPTFVLDIFKVYINHNNEIRNHLNDKNCVLWLLDHISFFVIWKPRIWKFLHRQTFFNKSKVANSSSNNAREYPLVAVWAASTASTLRNEPRVWLNQHCLEIGFRSPDFSDPPSLSLDLNIRNKTSQLWHIHIYKYTDQP